MGVKMTNSEIKCEQLRKLFEDHYWDTFESDKKIILKHIDFVLSLWNTRTPESIDSIEKLTKLVSSIALECKKLGLTQIETSNILKHTFGTPEPTKSENGLVRLSNKNWDVICQVLRNHHEQLANGDYLKCVNAIIETFGTPSITKEYKRNQPCGCVMCICQDEELCHGCGAKSCANWREEGHREKLIFNDESINLTKEQLLAILPEKRIAMYFIGDPEAEASDRGFNEAIDIMKQRIEELFNEKIN
jgi:hypothetical protein